MFMRDCDCDRLFAFSGWNTIGYQQSYCRFERRRAVNSSNPLTGAVLLFTLSGIGTISISGAKLS